MCEFTLGLNHSSALIVLTIATIWLVGILISQHIISGTLQENLRRHILSTTKHPGKSVYECRFCKKYHTNHAKEFRNHLIVHHEEEFGNGKDPTTYIAGIYEAQEDSTCLIDVENLDDPPEANETYEASI